MKKLKRWNVSFYREPVYEETQIKAKTAEEATKMFLSVVHDATVESVWELSGRESEQK